MVYAAIIYVMLLGYCIIIDLVRDSGDCEFPLHTFRLFSASHTRIAQIPTASAFYQYLLPTICIFIGNSKRKQVAAKATATETARDTYTQTNIHSKHGRVTKNVSS